MAVICSVSRAWRTDRTEEVLTAPVADRLIADAEHLGDRTASLDQVQDLLAELRRVGTGHRSLPGC
jgi:hypothetical protein